MQYALRTNGLAAFTSVAWDHSSPHPRLATGSVDGTVIIWTAEPQRAPQAPAVSNATILDLPEDGLSAISSHLSDNTLGLTTSPQASPPCSPKPSVKELPEPPTINIIEPTPKLTVPESEKTLYPE